MTFINTYRELMVEKPPTMRSRIRDLALHSIAGGFDLLHHRQKLFSRPRIQFLYIHHVFRDEEKGLARMLESLGREHTFISHSEAVRRLLGGDIDKPYISISSDDGLKNNLAAASIMAAYGVKGCFFVCPSMIGEQDKEKIIAFTRDRLHFPPVEFMDWKDIETLQLQGHEIGAHTLSHVNIASTPEEQLQDEIGGCFDIISARCGNPLHFAYPYGRFSDFTVKAKELVFSSGYESCSSAVRGCHIPGSPANANGLGKGKSGKEDILIRRDHVILDWPLRHILYFIARNALKADVRNNEFPIL